MVELLYICGCVFLGIMILTIIVMGISALLPDFDTASLGITMTQKNKANKDIEYLRWIQDQKFWSEFNDTK